MATPMGIMQGEWDWLNKGWPSPMGPSGYTVTYSPVTNQTQQPMSWTDNLLNTISNPNTILGTGLTLGSTLPRSEPGSVTEARQFLRNQFTSPTGLTSQFSGQLGALNDQYLPLLQQQANQTLDSIQQRAIAGLPTSLSTGMGGGEISALRQGFANQIVPQQQAHMADLARELMTRQSSAAGMLLRENTQNSLAQALGQLGGAFLNRGLGGQNSLFGGTQQSPLMQLLGNTAGSALSQGLGSLLGGGGGGNLLTSGMRGLQAAENPGTVDALTAALQGSPLPGTSGFTNMLGGTGGTLSGILGLLGAGAGGYFSGNAIGQQLPGTQLGGTAAGAGGGAAAGAIAGSVLPGIGTAIGAIVGALAGAGGGFFGSRAASAEEKAANLKADMDSQAGQGRAIADFFLAGINGLGGDTSGLMSQVANLINHIPDPGDQQGQIAQLLGPALLRSFQAKDPSITSLDAVPGLRTSFLDYLSRNAWVEPSAGQRSPFSLSGPGGTGDIVRLYEQYAGFTP